MMIPRNNTTSTLLGQLLDVMAETAGVSRAEVLAQPIQNLVMFIRLVEGLPLRQQEAPPRHIDPQAEAQRFVSEFWANG